MGLLKWALIFLIVSLIAAMFGFGGIAAAAAGIAQVLFYIFLVIFLALLLAALFTGPPPTCAMTMAKPSTHNVRRET